MANKLKPMLNGSLQLHRHGRSIGAQLATLDAFNKISSTATVKPMDVQTRLQAKSGPM